MKHTSQILNFTNIDCDTFLQDYWQKKPALLKQAIPKGVNPLSPEELAGLSLATEVESRIVLEQPNQTPSWQLQHGPFNEGDYAKLPKTHWTLLVQGVDRLIPEVQNLLNYFDFIPQWRVDDIMISYAAMQGSVGPHYDHYDVFLYQAQGQREWALTTQHCHDQNYLPNMDLRIMKTFNTEQTFLLNPGDVLYLPPHVGHHGVSLSEDCKTYSFGYRSYHGLEILNEFCDYLDETGTFEEYYKDPNWNTDCNTSELPDSTWQHAKTSMQRALSDDQALKKCFGRRYGKFWDRKWLIPTGPVRGDRYSRTPVRGIMVAVAWSEAFFATAPKHLFAFAEMLQSTLRRLVGPKTEFSDCLR